MVDPLAPQLIVYTTKSAFLAGLDNLAKWNYRPGPLPEFTPRLHYSPVSLCRAGLSLRLAGVTAPLLCPRSPGLWEQSEGSCMHTHRETPQKEASLPLPASYQCVQREAWEALRGDREGEMWVLH